MRDICAGSRHDREATPKATKGREATYKEVNMTNTLISVVVPVYNAENFLERTVSTIQAQTDPNFEILLVNDGSKDASLALCRRLEKEEPRIRVIDQTNQGVSAARNAGVRAAKGDWISFVDSDDLLYPGMLAALRAGMESACREGRQNVQIQVGREEIDEEGNLLPAAVTPPKEPTWISVEDFAKSLLLYQGDSSFCTKLTPKTLLLEHPFPVGRLAEDFYLEMELAPHLEGIYNLPEMGYRVVHRKGSQTRRARAGQFSRVYIAIVEAADYVEKELVCTYPALAQPARHFGLFERLDYLLHVPITDMNRKNTFYAEVCSYLKDHKKDVAADPWMGRKERLYLRLLTAAPVLTRRVHRLTMRIRGIEV